MAPPIKLPRRLRLLTPSGKSVELVKFITGFRGDTDHRRTTVQNFDVDVPQDTAGLTLTYFATGHHYEQTSSSDEFNRRRHHIYVDGKEVWSQVPWRTDGPDFRGVNPSSARRDGNRDGDTRDPYPIDVWSSDHARSGWVPGDAVTPYQIDLDPFITTPGRHTIGYKIDDIGPNSFWRVSSYRSGTAVPEPAACLPLAGGALLLLKRRR